MRLLIGRTDCPFQFTCDHCRFSLLAHEALEHANVFFCPRAELQCFLCHSTSSRNSMLRISSNLSNIDKSTQRQSTLINLVVNVPAEKWHAPFLFSSIVRHLCELDRGHSELLF